MDKNKFLFALAGALFALTLNACNGGVNLTIPTQQEVESDPIIAQPNDPNDPTTDPTPTPTPPATTGRNRIFVSRTMVTGINVKKNGQYFDNVCANEAKNAKLTGTFAALVNTNKGTFGSGHKVKGAIYQKAYGIETMVADSYASLIAGKNDDSIFASADQRPLDNSYKNYAWTGQNNFNQPPNSDLNCGDWTMDRGYGIVGQVGARGSDALAISTQPCNVIAHLYCIETN